MIAERVERARQLAAEFLMKLEESGERAYASGVGRAWCPLARGSAARSFWLCGWDRARKRERRQA